MQLGRYPNSGNTSGVGFIGHGSFEASDFAEEVLVFNSDNSFYVARVSFEFSLIISFGCFYSSVNALYTTDS